MDFSSFHSHKMGVATLCHTPSRTIVNMRHTHAALAALPHRSTLTQAGGGSTPHSHNTPETTVQHSNASFCSTDQQHKLIYPVHFTGKATSPSASGPSLIPTRHGPHPHGLCPFFKYLPPFPNYL